MVIIGFDPASARNLGWCLIDIEFNKKGITKFFCDAGTFILPLVNENWMVLFPMQVTVESFLCKNKPDIIVVEKTNNFQGPRGFVGGQVSQCMGVLLALAGKYELDVKFIFPTHCKKILTGSGKAKKAAIKKRTKTYLSKLGIKKPVYDSEHAYDAIANSLVWMIDNNILDALKTE